MQKVYIKRIKRLISELSKDGRPSALLLASAPPARRSGDSNFEYRQNSSFYYFTGIKEKDFALLVSSRDRKAWLIYKIPDSRTLLWEGSPPNPSDLADQLNVEIIKTSDPGKEILTLIRGHEIMHYPKDKGGLALEVAGYLFEQSPALPSMPFIFIDSDEVVSRLRLYKDRDEVALISRALDITLDALLETFSELPVIKTEIEFKNTLESHFLRSGCYPAFPSIAACGKSAATLHYERHARRLKHGEMLLLDCGAEYEYYCADITRVYPLSGRFDGLQKQLYNIVLAAQLAALSKVRHGVRIGSVYMAAVEELVIGLKSLKILKGSTAALIKREEYRPFFPHGIGHSLGIDTHDIGNLRGNNQAVLKEGMVFTVEPGLYFSKKVGKVPACGIRIEDDVLVTKSGCKILSNKFPKSLSDVQDFVESAM